MANNKKEIEQNGELPTEQMRLLLRQMADFIAFYETIDEKLTARENALENKLVGSERMLLEQLNHIKACFNDFKGIMTEAGAARWRISAENALKEGKNHIKNLSTTCNEVIKSVQENCQELQATTQKTLASINQSASIFQAEEYNNAASQGAMLIENASITQINRFVNLVKWFHWKNLTMAFALSIFIVFLSGLYVGDEWPWELHAQVVKERNAGKTLMAAWPRLSIVQQQYIINSSKNYS